MLEKNQSIGALLAFSGSVLFAGKAVIVKWVYLHFGISALPLLALRMIFSLPIYIILLISVKHTNETKLTSRELWSVLGLGFMGYYLASYFDFKGLELITASLERLILFSYPTLVVLLSAIFLRKSITKIQLVAIVITYIGICIAFIPDLYIANQRNFALGAIFVFLSSLSYAFYLMGSGIMIKKLGSIRFTSLALIVSSIVVLIHYGIEDNRSLLFFPLAVYFWAFVMAVFCTVVPSLLLAEAIKKIGASNASIIGTVGPLATILMANQFLGETFSLAHGFGTVLIIGGVMVVSLKKD